MARLKKVSTPTIGETYMINKKGWKKVSLVAFRGDDYHMIDQEAPYPWSYMVNKGDIYVFDADYTRHTPQQ
jgi:hypothetical protein